MTRVIFQGATPPAGPSGFEQAMPLIGAGLGEGLGQGMQNAFIGRQRQGLFDAMTPEEGFGEGDPRRKVLALLQSNPSLLADEQMFGQLMGMMKPAEDPAIVRAVEAAGVQRGTPEFRDAVLRGSGALESSPEIVRLQQARDQAIQAGDPARAAEIERAIQKSAGDLERARIAESRAARAAAAASGGGTDRGDQRDRKIAEGAYQLMHMRGLSPQEAFAESAAVIDGWVEYKETGITGQWIRIDKRTGRATEVAVAPLDQMPTPPEVAKGGGLYDRAESAAGVGPALTEAAARTVGQVVPVSEDAQRIVQDRTEFRLARGNLIRALSENPRFPVFEMQRLEEDTKMSPSMWDSPDALRANLRAVDKVVSDRIERERRAAVNPKLSRQDRSDAERAILDMEEFRRILNVPAAAAPPVEGDPNTPPSGFSAAEWNALSPAERAEALELLR